MSKYDKVVKRPKGEVYLSLSTIRVYLGGALACSRDLLPKVSGWIGEISRMPGSSKWWRAEFFPRGDHGHHDKASTGVRSFETAIDFIIDQEQRWQRKQKQLVTQEHKQSLDLLAGRG